MAQIQDDAPMTRTHSIVDLRALIDALPADDRARAERILHVSEAVGSLVPPESMHRWIVELFGSVEAVEHQEIVKTTNLVTMEGTLFNALRASRPFDSTHPDELEALLNTAGDPFCHPLEGTPADTFGRVRGDHCVTASNIAKYDASHGVVIFDDHNPLHFSRDSISDALDVGVRWAHLALEEDPTARYFFFMWNCLWKSGASILHGHAQVAATRGMHYAKVEGLRRDALAYRERHQTSYFDDLVALHDALGLTIHMGDTAIVPSLTPIKEKEVLLFAPGLTNDLRDAIAHVLGCYVHQLGVSSFNLAVSMPPLAQVPEDWSGFPHIVRIVDRGAPTNKTADFGAMELYAASVVASDPFRVADALRREA